MSAHRNTFCIGGLLQENSIMWSFTFALLLSWICCFTNCYVAGIWDIMTLIGCHYNCNIADNMGTWQEIISLKNISCSWGQHGAHLGPVGPRWAPCWPHEPCYQGYDLIQCCSSPAMLWIPPGCVEGLSQLLASVQVYYTLRQRQNGRHFTDDSQTTFSNVFSWMKMYEFWLKFHWSLFLRVQLTI